ALHLLRLSPQQTACGVSRGAVKLHTKIVLGLVLGAVCGVTANALAPDAAWVRWIGDNVAGPVGQGFLRLLLVTVIPRLFPLVTMVPMNPIQAAAGMDLLGVICFSLVFGGALTLVPEQRARPLVRVLEAVGETVIKIIDVAMKLAPYGVFGLIFFTTSRFGWG